LGQGAAAVLEFRVATLSPGALLVYPLTLLYLGAFASAVTVLSRFAAWGRLLNAAVMLVLFTFSGLVYPVGFFSAWGREAARSMPTHYSMIIARSHVLKGVDTGTFSDWWGPLVGFTLVTFLVLKLSAEWYKRGA
jgi:ABC-type polysaccharide/polyol phosphate export permease